MSKTFDDFMFMAIKNTRNIQEIVESFFSFLRRNTDFCHTILTPDQLSKFGLDNSVNKRGFLPNQMTSLVRRVVEENFRIYRKSHQPFLLDDAEKDAPIPHDKWGPPTPPAAPKQANGTKAPAPRKDSDSPFTINTWNGGVTDKYAWSQNFGELTVEVPSKERLTKSNVALTMTRDRLKLTLADQVVLDGQFCRPINVSESMWSIEDGARVLISIEKVEEYWWDCVLKGDATIDTQEIESSKRLDEFPPEERSAIMQIMAENRNRERVEDVTEEKDESADESAEGSADESEKDSEH